MADADIHRSPELAGGLEVKSAATASARLLLFLLLSRRAD